MKFFKSRLFRLIVAIISLIMVVTLSRSVYDLWRRKDIVSERQRVLRQAEEENRRFKQELAQVQTVEFIEKQVRDKLGLVRPGEAVVIVPKPADNVAAEETGPKLANWQKWWKLFF